jgi:hypothetical protein
MGDRHPEQLHGLNFGMKTNPNMRAASICGQLIAKYRFADASGAHKPNIFAPATGGQNNG